MARNGTHARRKSEGESSTREAILDAAEAIMREEGYAAVTSRRVGEAAGFKSKLVHYYFATMDDLFTALYERAEKKVLEQHLQALTAENPLRSLWESTLERAHTALGPEFIALSNHRKSIRKLIVRTGEQMNAMAVACIARYIKDRGLDAEQYPPAALARIVSSLSETLAREAMLGISGPRDEIMAFAYQWFDKIENVPPKSA
jgi:AcrR family transcriptional regulator